MKNFRTMTTAAFVFLGLFLCSQTVFALPLSLLGINDDTDQLVLFLGDTDGEVEKTVVTDGVPDEIEDLVWAGGGTYYGIQSFNKNKNSTKTSQLYKFELNEDFTAADISTVGDAFSGTDIDAIEYVDGVLYTMDNNKDELITIGTDGTVLDRQEVRSLGLKKVEGLAYRDGLLYASDTKNDGQSTRTTSRTDADSSLFSINISDGVGNLDGDDVQYIGQIGFGQVEALTFSDGLLYGASDIHNLFFNIDLTTGAGISLAEGWKGSDIEGIAVVPSGDNTATTPEPATMFLLGSGLAGIAGLKRKFAKKN